jgi:hypothetical protein
LHYEADLILQYAIAELDQTGIALDIFRRCHMVYCKNCSKIINDMATHDLKNTALKIK